MNNNIMINILCIIILIILFIWIYIDIMIDSKKKINLNICVALTILEIIAEIGCTLTDNTIIEYRNMSILFNTLGFSLTPFILIIESEFYQSKQNKFHKLAYIPAIINCIMVLLSPFTGWIFTVSEYNNYSRGEFFVIYLFAFFLSLIYSFYKKVKAINYLPSYFFIKSIISSLLIFPGFLIQVIFPQYKTTWLIMTIYLILYYGFISQMESLTDGLTGLLNRTAFNRQIELIKKHKDITTVIMIDIDDFKSINDVYGHSFGDQCMIHISNNLQHIFYRDKLFRYGGDEFIILSKTKESNQLDNKLKKLNQTLYVNNIPISLSYGYSIYKDNSIQEVIKKADLSMYKQKNEKKSIK